MENREKVLKQQFSTESIVHSMDRRFSLSLFYLTFFPSTPTVLHPFYLSISLTILLAVHFLTHIQPKRTPTHTRIFPHTHTPTHTFPQTHTHPHTLFLKHTPTHTHLSSNTHTHTHIFILIQELLFLSLFRKHYLSLSLSLSLSLIFSLSHSLTFSESLSHSLKDSLL